MKRQTLEDLKKIMATLRGSDGCPWDREQTPQSLTPYAVEEALELEEAVHYKTPKDVMEELGDVLFQVVFQSQMAEELGQFSLDDVIHHLSEKMIERHPHVFSQQKVNLTGMKVLHAWEKTKSAKTGSPDIFKMPKNFPALLCAVKIGKKTRTIDFDWPAAGDVFKQFMSEVAELKSAMCGRNKAHKEEEVGDALFTLAQVARLLNIDPEKALRLSNRKVVRRIIKAYELSGLSWKEYCALSVKKKEALWNQAKKVLKRKSPGKGKTTAAKPKKTTKTKTLPAKLKRRVRK